MEHLFGTSGVRGYINSTLSPTVAVRLTNAFLYTFKGVSSAVVLKDPRAQSEPLLKAVNSVLLSSGVHIYNVGMAPTPVGLWLMRKLKADATVAVTGSHTPAQICGLLFFLKDGGELTTADASRVEDNYFKERARLSSWRSIESEETIPDVAEEYTKELRRKVPRLEFNGARKVIFDAGNGASGPFAKAAFEELGLNHEILNISPDGRFPNRLPSPIPAHLKGTSDYIKRHRGGIGIATDADGDRAIFFDEEGGLIWGDVAGALFAKDALRSNPSGRDNTIITTINTSDAVEDIVSANGGRLVRTKVGPPALVEAIRENPTSLFAVEESGKYIWPDILMYGDSVLSTLKMLKLTEKETLLSMRQEVPNYYLLKMAVRVIDEQKVAAMKFVKNGLKARSLDLTDGIKAMYGNRSWLLIRPSGTEPLIRIFAQGIKRKEAQRIAKEGVKLVREALQNQS
ncbi:MAG: hypothetical protein JRN37_01205 [Nitrososphaerota archaeon]|jgi:phosphomannomutase|nr:hypothetical protein [Nitrososphaerota archaeon]MDG7036165.1 hypothetical protein [Nitrososphaerota archaeon]MDG7037771.1 hypothetical protein [Nitrososphaerota archaeon]